MADPTSVSVIIASWFTPSSLFIFVNLVIGTIAITSRFSAPKRQIHHDEQLGPHDSPQLVRSPSLIERVRSFRHSYCSYEPVEPTASFTEPECTQPQLVRTPSFLERVRSIGLGHYYSYYEPTAFAETESTQPQLVRTPSLLERVRSFNFGLHKNETSHAEREQAQAQAHQPESEDPCSNQNDPKEPQLTRAPSLLQRLQSINLSRLYRSNSTSQQEEPEPETEGPVSDPGGKEAEVKKSASERGRSVKSEWEGEDEEKVEERRPATARAETTSLGEDEEVDAKADDFINRFKKQLRLQRVDSILRYREMLRAN